MRDPRTCPHESTAPVDVRDPHTGAVGTVARICVNCLEQLPVWWGCVDCGYAEVRNLVDVHPIRYLTQPCPRHEEHA